MNFEKRNWSNRIDFVDIKNYQSVQKQIEVNGSKIDYRINILNRESPSLVVNIPGVGDNGLKDLQHFSEAFESDPFFNVITFSNPKPYTPEIVSNGVCEMLTDVENEIPKPKAIILHAYSQGAVATWNLLNDGITEKFPIKGIVLQVPIINRDNVSNLLKISNDHFRKLIGVFVDDPEQWNQEMEAVMSSNNTLKSIIETPTLLVTFNKDGLVDNVATKEIVGKSFSNLETTTFLSNKKMVGHDTDHWNLVMRKELEFMKNVFSKNEL